MIDRQRLIRRIGRKNIDHQTRVRAGSDLQEEISGPQYSELLFAEGMEVGPVCDTAHDDSLGRLSNANRDE
jgi:hypothetical protein